MDLKGGMALDWGVPLEEWAVSEEGKVCGEEQVSSSWYLRSLFA